MKNVTINLATITEMLAKNKGTKDNLNEDFNISNKRCEKLIRQLSAANVAEADNYGELVQCTLEEAMRVGETESEVFYLFFHLIFAWFESRQMAKHPMAELLAAMGR